MGFCHNDTQYGNLLLHTASNATLEASADAVDMLDTRGSFEELPPSQLQEASVTLGSSPPSYSSLRMFMVICSTRLFKAL